MSEKKTSAPKTPVNTTSDSPETEETVKFSEKAKALASVGARKMKLASKYIAVAAAVGAVAFTAGVLAASKTEDETKEETETKEKNDFNSNDIETPVEEF